MTQSPQRSILHVDMDAFFASVELLRHPELLGRPVIVGGSGARGVVAAASYEARSYGVHSAMPSVQARRLCPDAVFLHGDHAHYREVSSVVMATFERWTPLVEPLSLDEAFLDVTGSRRLFGDPTEVARRIRAEVYSETSLHCSIGVARNKFLAKLSTSRAKPRPSRRGPLRGEGVFHLSPESETSFLATLPVEKLWGVGPATLSKITPLGIRMVGDLLEINPKLLSSAVGQGSAERLRSLAAGIDDRPVEPHADPKSISHEETFAVDVSDRDELHAYLVRQVDGVSARLRSHSLKARTVHLKVRYGSFRTITRSRSIELPTDSGVEILAIASDLMASVPIEEGIRLVGVGTSSFTTVAEPVVEQLSFDEFCAKGEPDRVTWSRANSAVDLIRARFGADVIGPAASAQTPNKDGDHQWGPAAPGAEERGSDAP